LTDEPQLRMKAAYEVDCHDLDKFVAIHLEPFGKTWNSLEADAECHNGSYATAEVHEGVVIEDDLYQDFGRWITGEGPFYLPEDERYAHDLPGVHHMLQFLCNRGKIPAGKYVVELWW
jgi:hypothetical protein